MLNVVIKLVQYDSLKRFGVPNYIIYIYFLFLLVIIRESFINLCVVTQITQHLLHIMHTLNIIFYSTLFCTHQFLSLLSTLDWALNSSVSLEGTLPLRFYFESGRQYHGRDSMALHRNYDEMRVVLHRKAWSLKAIAEVRRNLHWYQQISF